MDRSSYGPTLERDQSKHTTPLHESVFAVEFQHSQTDNYGGTLGKFRLPSISLEAMVRPTFRLETSYSDLLLLSIVEGSRSSLQDESICYRHPVKAEHVHSARGTLPDSAT